jgi:hypothetical protein
LLLPPLPTTRCRRLVLKYLSPVLKYLSLVLKYQKDLFATSSANNALPPLPPPPPSPHHPAPDGRRKGRIRDRIACSSASLHLHTPAYVSIRQHTLACEFATESRAALHRCTSIRQHTTAFVRIRQHANSRQNHVRPAPWCGAAYAPDAPRMPRQHTSAYAPDAPRMPKMLKEHPSPHAPHADGCS